MPKSSASSVLFLPFGALTGVIPTDSVQRVRVIGDFSRVIGCDRRADAADDSRFVGRPDAVCTAWPLSL